MLNIFFQASVVPYDISLHKRLSARVYSVSYPFSHYRREKDKHPLLDEYSNEGNIDLCRN